MSYDFELGLLFLLQAVVFLSHQTTDISTENHFVFCIPHREKLLYCDRGFIAKEGKEELDNTLHETIVIFCIQIKTILSDKRSNVGTKCQQSMMDEG